MKQQEENYDNILTTSPSENEKNNMIISLFDMRNEASFCDVGFLIHGCLFRAHKIIVSSWSRWMYALLAEGSEQEIISLDIFTPVEFGAILDYMYGQPLEFSIENAEAMLKIIRRMELKTLEQKCWKFLLSIVDASNCEKLHKLADFFDCTPLKLTAWRVIQENKPGYSTAPAQILQELSTGTNGGFKDFRSKNPRRRMIGHGLIGPGERLYDSNYDDSSSPRSNRLHHDDSDDDDEGTVSIFNASFNSDNDGGEGLLSNGQKRFDYYVRPDQLPKGTPAKEVIRSWAFRLQQIYQECCDLQPNVPINSPFGQQQQQQQQRHQQNQQNYQQQRQLGTPQHNFGQGSTPFQSKDSDNLRRSNNIPVQTVTRMPSLDRISDLSDPQVQPINKMNQYQNQNLGNNTPNSQNSNLSIQNQQKNIGGRSSIRPSITSRQYSGNQISGGLGGYPEPIEEKETDSVSTEEKEMNYQNTPFSKQSQQTYQSQQSQKAQQSQQVQKQLSLIDWKEELKKFYISRGLIDKLDTIDTILAAWEGKEKDMIEALYGKYQMKIPSELQERLKIWEREFGE